MSLSDLCYSIHQQLKTTIPELKRSQVYELVASVYGFASYASMTQTALQFVSMDELSLLSLDESAFRQRMRSLNASSTRDSQIWHIFNNAVLVHDIFYINPFNLSELVHASLESDDPVSSSIFHALLKAHTQMPYEAIYPYLLAQYYLVEDWQESSGMIYQYNRLLKGEEINPAFRDDLDSYLKSQEDKNHYINYLEKSALLGLFAAKNELYEFLSESTDQSKRSLFESYNGSVNFDNMQYELFRRGDARILSSFFEDLIFNSLEWGDSHIPEVNEENRELAIEVWSCHYFASALGIDLLKGNLRAIDEHGNDYDDDIGGPMYVDGCEDIKLPALAQEDDILAFQKAQTRINEYKELSSREFSFWKNHRDMDFDDLDEGG